MAPLLPSRPLRGAALGALVAAATISPLPRALAEETRPVVSRPHPTASLASVSDALGRPSDGEVVLAVRAFLEGRPAVPVALRPLRMSDATTAAAALLGADDPPPAPPPERPATPPSGPAPGNGGSPSTPSDVEVLPDVVVTDTLRQPVASASPLGPTPVLEAPRPVGQLGGDELRYRERATIGDTLAHEPGVTSSSFGPGASRPLIRGQGGERIRVLENGTGTLDVSSLSDDHAIPVDPTSVGRIEVLRGPATLRYGPSAIGGVVYVHDGRIPEEPIGRRLAGRAGGALGTADEERSGFLVVEGQHGAWSWRGSGFARESDDIDIPGFAKSRRLLEQEGNPDGVGEPRGTLPNSYAQAHGGGVGLSRIGPRGFVGASFSAFSTEYGVPNEPEVHIELDRIRADARGRSRHPLGGVKEISWALAFADYEHTEFEGTKPGRSSTSRPSRDAARPCSAAADVGREPSASKAPTPTSRSPVKRHCSRRRRRWRQRRS
jgi:hypothetical protein